MSRMNNAALKELVLNTALQLAKVNGFQSLTRDGVATEAGIAMGQVNHAYGTMNQLKRAVMRAAVHREELSIIAFGVVTGDKEAHKAPKWLQDKALNASTSSAKG